jgi:hypothetical protein
LFSRPPFSFPCESPIPGELQKTNASVMVASSLEHCLEARASLSIGERDHQQSSFKLLRQTLLHSCSFICKRIRLSASVGVLYAVRNRKVCSRRGVMAHALLEPINVISGRRGWEIEECFLSVAGGPVLEYPETSSLLDLWCSHSFPLLSDPGRGGFIG